MVPARYDIGPVYEGDTWSGMTLRLRAGGLPVDLTGAEVVMEARKTQAGAVAGDVVTIATNDGSGGIAITEPMAGTITVQPLMLGLGAGTHHYDLRVVYPDGRRRTYLRGRIEVEGRF